MTKEDMLRLKPGDLLHMAFAGGSAPVYEIFGVVTKIDESGINAGMTHNAGIYVLWMHHPGLLLHTDLFYPYVDAERYGTDMQHSRLFCEGS